MGQHRQLPERLRQVHPTLPHALHRDPRLLRRSRSLTVIPGETDLPGDDVLVRRDALVHDRARLGDPAAPDAARTASAAGSRRCNVRVRGRRGAADRGARRASGPFGAWVVVMALDPVTLAVGGGWMLFGIALYVALPALPGAAADRDGQGGDCPSRSGSRRSSTGASWSPSRTTRRSPRRRSRPRSSWPRSAGAAIHVDLDADRAHEPAARRAARGRRRREAQSKIEQAKLIGGPAGQRARAPGPARTRPATRSPRRREEIEGERARDGAALPQRRPALRQDAADGAGRAALPGDRRRRAGRRGPRRRAAGAPEVPA